MQLSGHLRLLFGVGVGVGIPRVGVGQRVPLVGLYGAGGASVRAVGHLAWFRRARILIDLTLPLAF